MSASAGRARYRRLKAAGTCVKCGRLPSYEGRVLCSSCNELHLPRVLAAAKKTREKYRARGGCVVCGKPVAPERRRYCRKHLDAKAALERKKWGHKKREVA